MYDFCQNDGEVIESEDGTPSYESEENQEQVGCWYFQFYVFSFIKVFEGLCNDYQVEKVAGFYTKFK